MSETHEPAYAAGVRIGLFGMAPDTGNMGVSALCQSFLAAMRRRIPDSTFIIFDNGRGQRVGSMPADGEDVPVVLCGARGGRRYYRPENLSSLCSISRLGPLARINPVLRLVDSCDVIMDVSAGDSFSDIYGQSRFRAICQPKLIASQRRKPLLLLPQTYGPYRSEENADAARRAILKSTQAWARDGSSFRILQELLGEAFNPERHLEGVDMAFGLPLRRPDTRATADLTDWLDHNQPILGFNVSGLVWNQTTPSDNRFGFNADYRVVVQRFAEWVLEQTKARILFIPHVHAARGSAESDLDAIESLLGESGLIRQALGQRVQIAPDGLGAQESKWLIGRCSWFVGTRMHATIAALSSGVPTASLVYSNKAEGVFSSCDQQEQVVDPRELTTSDAIERLIGCYKERETARSRLAIALEGVTSRLEQQMQSIARFALEQR